MIKQADILRAVFRLRPDLQCIERHCGSLLPFFAGTFLLVPSRTANCLQGLVALSWTEIVRYVRIRLHLRLVFLGQFVKSPGHRLSRTYPSIQAVLSDSHIGDFCPRGADFREEGVLRSKARAARPSAGPRVPPPRRLARSREPPLLLLARSCGVECGSPYPARVCASLAIYPRGHVLHSLSTASLACPALAVPSSSRNVTRAVFRSPPCRSPTSRLQSPWRAILDRLHVSSFVAPQTKTLKCPLRFATGTSNVSFQGNLACCLLGYADGGINLRAGGSRPANGIVGQAAADSTCAEMRSRALTARHLYLSAVGFYLYSKRFPRHLPRPT